MTALDTHAAALRGETPWVEMSRSDVVRWLLSRALEHELGKAQGHDAATDKRQAAS